MHEQRGGARSIGEQRQRSKKGAKQHWMREAKRSTGRGSSKRRKENQKPQHDMQNREQTGSRKRGQMNKQREVRRRPRGGIKQQSRAVGQREKKG